MKYFTILLFSLLFGNKLQNPNKGKIKGTVIVAVGTSNLILIAADSRFFTVDSCEEMRYGGITCKVHYKDSIIWALTGYSSLNEENRFDVEKSINEITFKDSTLRGKVQEICDKLIDSIYLFIPQSHCDEFDSTNNVLCDFVFGAFDNKKAIMAQLIFFDNIDIKTHKHFVSKTIEVVNIEKNNTYYLPIGHHAFVDSIFKRDANYFNHGISLLQSLTNLITLQAKSDSIINDTIDVIGVDTNGVHWYQKNQECYQ